MPEVAERQVAELQWSKDRPHTSGWYWYRGPMDHAPVTMDAVVAYVSLTGSLTGFRDGAFAWQPFMDYEASLDSFAGEWAGPIKPPE